jgi:hypothetical protein
MIDRIRSLVLALPVSLLAVLPVAAWAEPAASAPQGSNTNGDQAAEARETTSPDLGPPLVNNADKLTRLDPKYPIWVDKQGKQVVLVGAVCMRSGPLELFACLLGSKEYESVVSVPGTARLVQTALLAVGGETGSPVRFDPQYTPPRGTTIAVNVTWKDKQGRLKTVPAQQWVRKVGTSQSLETSWVFAGSHFAGDAKSGKMTFVADVTGDLVCVANFPSAVLDVPLKSTNSDAELLFEAFTERIPERGTPVTLVLKPQFGPKVATPDHAPRR